ncbi:hypothetical protein HOY82DRAFT_476802 [Tuber indicum]|nr:hypothetical protein HOY82DRAFT_476802 [Tuber indicum]
MYWRALSAREKTLRPDHQDSLNSVNSLGTAINCQEKHHEAEIMHRRALTGREKTLGIDHPDTFKCVNNLGRTLQRDNRRCLRYLDDLAQESSLCPSMHVDA